MFYCNTEELRDKIHACWIGKNIGGTIGGPYEGKKEMLHIEGFASSKGEPLPNDDLDLQLVWLNAIEQFGPARFDASILAEFWMTRIPPTWNEYGVCKANLDRGFLPPLSGEMDNDVWKTSNGAWIRSEVWACLAPGFSGIARKYAYYDGIVDHGLNEGTIAEIFTATMESEAFVNTNIRELIEIGLANIPEESRVAKAVRLVVEEYDKGTDYREVREMLVKQSEDIGFFQAPANIGFVIIGLLYGEGDFKSSILHAVNCGDDTDCTAATVGALLGIIGGTAAIPADWQEYIGDGIKSISVNGVFHKIVPKNCTILTDKVIRLIPGMLKAHGIDIEFTDEKCTWPAKRLRYGMNVLEKFKQPVYSLELPTNLYVTGNVFLNKKPILAKGDTLTVTFDLKMLGDFSSWCEIKVLSADGLVPTFDKIVHIHGKYTTAFTVKLEAIEDLQPKSTVYIILDFDGHAVPILLPVSVLGK